MVFILGNTGFSLPPSPRPPPSAILTGHGGGGGGRGAGAGRGEESEATLDEGQEVSLYDKGVCV
ncbi:hypothetical protein CRUP_014837 [Coryphaenoides rupestris]|nr:hypothetical protein CRUP_014837 [Coryphaenoides rupestris]